MSNCTPILSLLSEDRNNLEIIVLDKIVYKVDSSDMIINKVSFIIFLVNCYSNRLIQLIMQLFLIPSTIKEFMDLSS
jgi:hypothetical protein